MPNKPKPSKPAAKSPAKSPAKPPAKSPSKPTANGKPGTTLPAPIVNALPVAAQVMQHLGAAAKLIPDLEKQLTKAKKGGAISLARAFVALHRMNERFDEMFKPLFGKDQLFDRYKTVELPELFEQEGIKNVPLAEGFRVQISSRFLASIKADEDPDKAKRIRELAYQWLMKNGLGDIIRPTVNASSLSSGLKELMEEKNVDAPAELFNVALAPNTSVVKT